MPDDDIKIEVQRRAPEDPRLSGFKEQFVVLVRMLRGIEHAVFEEGPLDVRVVAGMAKLAQLSPTGTDTLEALIQHSPKLTVRDVGEVKLIMRNPEFIDGQFPLD